MKSTRIISLMLLLIVGLAGSVWAKTVSLSWDASPSGVTGYKVYYKAGSSTEPLNGTGATEGNSPIDVGNSLNFTVNGLPDSDEHYFAVTAYDASGNESGFSNSAHSTVVQSDPGTGSAGDKNVTLSWDASPSNVSGYKIYYKEGSSTAPWDGTGASAGSSPIDVGNVLTFTVNGLPQSGDHYFAVTSYDGSGNESDYSNIAHSSASSGGGGGSPANTAPQLASIGNNTRPEGAAWNFILKASDADGDSLTFSAKNLPQGASLNSSTGAFSWTPTFDQSGSYSLIFSVSDGSLIDSETVSFSVTNVNRPPVLQAIGNKTAQENNNLSFSLVANDPDGGSLSFTATNLPTGATFNASTKTFSWTPGFDQAGSHSATFKVSDGNLNDVETISIAVNDGNRAPVLGQIGTKTIGEGSPLSFTISASDPDNDQLSYTATGLPTGATFDAATRTFNWTPAFAASENTQVHTVTFSVSDSVANDSETVSINVTNVNRKPVFNSIANKSLVEGDSLNIVVEAIDPDSNPLTYSASGLPDGAVFIASTRSFSWIPGADQEGSYEITFAVTDGSLNDSQTITLTVQNGNETPVLDAIGAKTIAENSQLSFTLTASDPNSDSLTYSASGLPTGASFNAEQRLFSWTPDYSQSGSYTASFAVTDGTYKDTETITISVTNTNQPPTISGAPVTTIMAGTGYTFAPDANDPDNDKLSFSISNKPAWADFNQATGQLSGNPEEQHIGSSEPISISVSDGAETVALTSFAVEVQPYQAQDSDGDGVLDHLDPFPNDSEEWLDTDGDQLGNNADPDDDNDGIADAEDGYPLDATKAGFLITSTAGTGGFITPEGEKSVVYGGSQNYNLTPKAGYMVKELLVDGANVGQVASYTFDNVNNHHSLQATFAPLPSGLSVETDVAGLDAVERVDGGDERSNLVDGNPKLDLDYVFRVALRDSVAASERRVFLFLDGYRYEMRLENGALASGATYAFTTRMGPAFSHSFYFTAEDSNGGQLYRYPQDGELAGPTIELLNGKNVIAVAANIDHATLDSQSAFNVSQAYRFIPATKLTGNYEQVDRGGPVVCGEGYVLKRTPEGTLPDLEAYSDLPAATSQIQMQSGWNLIANPYKGNVALADIQVQQGNSAPVDWSTAVNSNLVVDGVYHYLGKDWGNTNAFQSAAGKQSAVLTPWIGYWFYINPTDQAISLLIQQPQQ